MPAESMPASPGSSVRGAKKKSPSDAARIILFRFPLSSFSFAVSGQRYPPIRAQPDSRCRPGPVWPSGTPVVLTRFWLFETPARGTSDGLRGYATPQSDWNSAQCIDSDPPRIVDWMSIREAWSNLCNVGMTLPEMVCQDRPVNRKRGKQLEFFELGVP